MPTYESVPGDVHATIDAAPSPHHPELVAAEVRVGAILALATKDEHGEKKGPAIRPRGHPRAATIKVNSLKDRVEGEPDATITVDGDQWPGWSEAERAARPTSTDSRRAASLRADSARRRALAEDYRRFGTPGLAAYVDRWADDDDREAAALNRSIVSRRTGF